MSMIGNEVLVRIVNAVKDLNSPDRAVELIQNKPNPFDEYTIIPIVVNDRSKIRSAALIITDARGTQIQHMDLNLIEGVNEIFFELPYGALSETYYYSLVVNGDILQTLKMQVLNW